MRNGGVIISKLNVTLALVLFVCFSISYAVLDFVPKPQPVSPNFQRDNLGKTDWDKMIEDNKKRRK
jgi:hypothetical protein